MSLTLRDVYGARRFVYRTLRPTPLLKHPLLARESGLDVYVKHENHNATSAFKVRGGLNLIGNLDADERRGVITASTGNHGQSIAMACQREGVPCTVVVPEGNNPDKNAAMCTYGATIVEVGRDFDDARA
jgi:threonine dehydratase